MYCSVGRIWELPAGSRLALSNRHFDSSWKRKKANFSGEGATVSQEKISSWSCSEYKLACKPGAARSYYPHVHTIELRAQPLGPFLGDPYKIPLTKAALCASRGTPASYVKDGGKKKNPTTPFSHTFKWCDSYLAASLLEIPAQPNSTHHMGH